jgi:limonene-1,2-epoxide hydrolase
MAEAWKVVEDWAAALDRADLDGSLDYVAPEVEFSNPVATTHGPAELRALFDVFWTALPDFKHEFSQVLEDDGIVAIEGIASGTHQGPLASPTGEIPPTGEA